MVRLVTCYHCVLLRDTATDIGLYRENLMNVYIGDTRKSTLALMLSRVSTPPPPAPRPRPILVCLDFSTNFYSRNGIQVALWS